MKLIAPIISALAACACAVWIFVAHSEQKKVFIPQKRTEDHIHTP